MTRESSIANANAMGKMAAQPHKEITHPLLGMRMARLGSRRGTAL
jgi:hypothetical protein